jgi:hypothetical protein
MAVLQNHDCAGHKIEWRNLQDEKKALFQTGPILMTDQPTQK